MATRLNPFNALDNVQSSYRSYVETFQNVDDETINAWIENRIETGKVLWKEPFVQLNQRFQYGDTLDEFVADGTLHKGILDVFTGAGGDPIEPYKHQTEAIHSIQAGNNTIVSTGTGSGKSFAFGIPIVSHCLEAKERGEDGIKAVIIYPMNALANSQYEDFAERLDGTGLRLGLYTGDTPHNPDEAPEFLRQFGREEAYDSEVVSREEMQEDPPDILMTNYVMLDLILTRHDDKKLFREMHSGILQYLVLDEIHTYTGQQGADVAALIRRLKQNTDAGDELVCIGTSATVQSDEGFDADDEIANFTEKIFGEPIDADHVVRESHYPLPLSEDESLPSEITVTENDIESFDGSLEDAQALTEKLLDRGLLPAERGDPGALGNALEDHPTIKFLDEELSTQSQQIFAGEDVDGDDLVSEYQEAFRPDADRQAIERELQAALLVGTVGTTEIQGEEQPIFIPKLHTFFSQGSGLVACITDESFEPEEPHLSDAGDIECRTCAQEHDRTRTAYPLSFCRGCGQEYYTVTIDGDYNVSQGALSEIAETEEGKDDAYLMRGSWDRETAPLPDEWLNENGQLTDTYTEAEPRPATFCPECDQLTPGRVEQGQLECGCFAAQGVEVMEVNEPFLFCPNCGIHYTRRVRNEFNKLFTFGTVGRSTATDVLIGNTMRNLPDDQQKTIAFSDNRQDTALQAAHLNNLYQRVRFRRSLYHTLASQGDTSLISLGNDVFDLLEEEEALPSAIDSGMFGPSAEDRQNYSRYLLFNAILELGREQQRTQQSLEDVGLIDVEYENLDRLAAVDDVWDAVPVLSSKEPEIREEYVHGFLDIFRRSIAIDHESTTNYADFKRNVINQLDEDVHFHGQEFFNFPVGYSDTASTGGRHRVRRLTHPRSRHVRWTKRALDVDTDTAKEIINTVIEIISDDEILKLLTQESLQYTGKVYMLNHSAIHVTNADPAEVRVCPKCGTPTTRRELDVCLNYSCDSIIPEDTTLETSYFYDLYTESFDDAVDIKAGEHSGQVDNEDRKELESDFREGESVNTIVSTPTMELGIDIGDLSNVYMRNVPPNPSNYAQRSGRAGRQNQPSLVTTFCGRGFGRGSHDQYFYRNPERIIAGEISPPTFLLNNQDLIEAHINSLVLEQIGLKFQSEPRQMLVIDPDQNDHEIMPDYRQDLEQSVQNNRQKIIEGVMEAFEGERTAKDTAEWFTEEFVENQVDSFVENLDEAFDDWRMEYRRLSRELRRLNQLLRTESGSYQDRTERNAIEDRLEDMRSGERRFYTYQYLRNQGFLPNYGFPRQSTTLTFTSREDDIRRDQTRAIKEFAPGNHVYYAGERFAVRYARPRTEDAEPITRTLRVCEECESILMGDDAKEAAACPACESSFEGTHPNPNAMELPNQHARPEEYITSDEEERRREGYDIQSYYEPSDVTEFDLSGDGTSAHLTYEDSANIVLVNSGLRDSDDDDIDGFALCMECNRWLTSEDQIESHTEEGDNSGCYANASEEAIKRGIEIYSDGKHDTVTVTTGVPEQVEAEKSEAFYRTLKEALYQGVLVAFDLDEEEIDTFLKPAPGDTGQFTIVIYETSEGGAGVLHALMDTNRIRQVIGEAQTVLHGSPDEEGCERACYECLMSFYNQSEHNFFDRELVEPWLAAMEDASLTELESEGSKGGDFEELYATCESSFEREVLEAVNDQGFALPDEAQHTIYDGNEPVTKPDFFYDRPERPIAVFVDGPDHEKDYVQQDDDRKRSRLKRMGYRVISVNDLGQVPQIWESI
jgi:ATP-dependent helicase YprA (DUF1998 family)/ribosomal protein L37AE/L43A